MEIVILVGTGVIAVFFWVLLLLIFCNMRRVRCLPLLSLSWAPNGVSVVPFPIPILPSIALRTKNKVPILAASSSEKPPILPC